MQSATLASASLIGSPSSDLNLMVATMITLPGIHGSFRGTLPHLPSLVSAIDRLKAREEEPVKTPHVRHWRANEARYEDHESDSSSVLEDYPP